MYECCLDDQYLIKDYEFIMSWLLRRKHHFKRNLGSPVKNYSRVSLICFTESVKRGLILSGCDAMLLDTTKVSFSLIVVSLIEVYLYYYLTITAMLMV